MGKILAVPLGWNSQDEVQLFAGGQPYNLFSATSVALSRYPSSSGGAIIDTISTAGSNPSSRLSISDAAQGKVSIIPANGYWPSSARGYGFKITVTLSGGGTVSWPKFGYGDIVVRD